MRNIPIIPACSGLNSGQFDEVMVSTDSEAYAEIARRYGAKVQLTYITQCSLLLENSTFVRRCA